MWKLNYYFSTGKVYEQQVGVKQPFVADDSSSSEEETTYIVPTPSGDTETHLFYPGSSNPVSKLLPKTDPRLVNLSDSGDGSIEELKKKAQELYGQEQKVKEPDIQENLKP